MLAHTHNAQSILKDYDLRLTDCRSAMLDLFLTRPHALDNAEIEAALPQSFDRVTVYRTLRMFLVKGIIHKVLDDAGTPKYAICTPDTCSPKIHHHQHAHFKCQQCGQTSCLSGVDIPAVQLPEGYLLQEANLLLRGICPTCHQLAHK